MGTNRLTWFATKMTSGSSLNIAMMGWACCRSQGRPSGTSVVIGLTRYPLQVGVLLVGGWFVLVVMVVTRSSSVAMRSCLSVLYARPLILIPVISDLFPVTRFSAGMSIFLRLLHFPWVGFRFQPLIRIRSLPSFCYGSFMGSSW